MVKPFNKLTEDSDTLNKNQMVRRGIYHPLKKSEVNNKRP